MNFWDLVLVTLTFGLVGGVALYALTSGEGLADDGEDSVYDEDGELVEAEATTEETETATDNVVTLTGTDNTTR